jgi:tetratricopeptide (TPR) repeat protein
VRREQGRLDELDKMVASTPELYPSQMRPYMLAYIHARHKRRTQARQHLESLAPADFGDVPRNAYWLTNLSLLCEVVVFLDDVARARLLYTSLLPYADRCVVNAAMCQGPVSHYLGLLSTTSSRYHDAERHFEQALAMSARIKSPLWIAHTQHDYANMLRLRNQPGDRDKALELLTQAISTAQRLGLNTVADKAETLKLATEATSRRPARLQPE